MNTKILVVGFASLTLFAAAQSQSNDKKDAPKATTAVKSPRDLASGQASGRTAASEGVVHRDLAARDAATGQASGKKTAQDDWNQQKAAAPANSPGVKGVSAADMDADSKADRSKGYNVKSQSSARVAAGDVNGDGVEAVKAPRDSSTGMATGKRQHQPISITKESDQKPAK